MGFSNEILQRIGKAAEIGFTFAIGSAFIVDRGKSKIEYTIFPGPKGTELGNGRTYYSIDSLSLKVNGRLCSIVETTEEISQPIDEDASTITEEEAEVEKQEEAPKIMRVLKVTHHDRRVTLTKEGEKEPVGDHGATVIFTQGTIESYTGKLNPWGLKKTYYNKKPKNGA